MYERHNRGDYLRALLWMCRTFGVWRTFRYERKRLAGGWIYYTPEQAALISDLRNKPRQPLPGKPLPRSDD